MARMPLVAVSIARDFTRDTGVPVHMSPEAYTRALTSVGIIPLLIPSTLHTDALRQVYERVDGILLSGGGDINPSCMSPTDQDPSLAIEIDEARDGSDLQLARWAVEDDKPLLGICRGHQVLNVALGGTLILDIPSLVGTAVKHKMDATPRWRSERLHPVEVCENTQLAAILGSGQIPVNSIHHQAIRDLGKDLQVTALAPDGIIEAIEVPNARFVLSVQWHPEEIYDTMQPLFQTFADKMQ